MNAQMQQSQMSLKAKSDELAQQVKTSNSTIAAEHQKLVEEQAKNAKTIEDFKQQIAQLKQKDQAD